MYEMYKTVKSKDEYFKTWERENVEMLTEALKDKIYRKYVVKAFVFQRDQFKCRNINCKNPSSHLTMHHIKFQKNDGEDKVKNCITICKSCHNSFHKGKGDLTFDGMTYRIHKVNEINWKVIKRQNRKLRKEVMQSLERITISAALFEQLMKFLHMDLEEEMDDD